MEHPYQGAYDFEFTIDYNGILTAEELGEMKRLWIEFVDSAHPLTYDLYKQMDRAQQRRHRAPRVFKTCGGLKVVTRGIASRRYRDITKKYADIALQRAKQARQAAGWKGRNYLTTPEGIKVASSGTRFGRYTMPNDEWDRGMWDGVLTAEKDFTV